MRRFICIIAAVALAFAPATPAYAWGDKGHSIVAEIAQGRLTPRAARRVEALLGRGRSLASVASWADDVRRERPMTSRWHYVNIPLAEDTYAPVRDCVADPRDGDCIIAALDRLAVAVRCAPTTAERAEALRYIVHFVGDLHQPLHTILEEEGGNGVTVTVQFRGATCSRCESSSARLHAVWDTTVIDRTVWAWGAYVDRMQGGWLLTDEARNASGGSPTEWAQQSHAVARTVWAMTPVDGVLGEDYYQAALPIIDRQLGLAGVHLASFLNEAFASRRC